MDIIKLHTRNLKANMHTNEQLKINPKFCFN